MEDKKAFGSLKRKLSDIMGAAAVMAKEMDPQEQLPFSMVQAQIEAAYKSLLISEGILFPASALLNKPKQQEMKTYGEFGVVKLTEEQYSKLVQGYGEKVIEKYINSVELYVRSKKVTYYDYYATILSWLKRDGVRPFSVSANAEARDDMILRRFMEG